MSVPDVESLVRALGALPSRQAHLLVRRFVDGESREAFAEALGVSPGASDVLLLRAVLAFEAAVAGAAPPGLLDSATEASLAAALREALAGGAGLSTLSGARGLVAALVGHREAVREALRKAEAQAEASPARRREERLRWLLIGLVLALTAFFYWRQQQAEPKPPAPRQAPR